MPRKKRSGDEILNSIFLNCVSREVMQQDLYDYVDYVADRLKKGMYPPRKKVE